MMRAVLNIATAATLAGCSSQPKADASFQDTEMQGTSYFATEIAPVLQTACVSCHLTGEEAGNISLLPRNAIAMTVDVQSIEAPQVLRIAPGKPDESYLMMKLNGTHIAGGGSGSHMPFGAAPLPDETIAKFSKWIEQGARP